MSYRRRVSQTTTFYQNIRISKEEKKRPKRSSNVRRREKESARITTKTTKPFTGCGACALCGLPSVWIWSLNSSINNLIVHLMNLLLFSFTSKCARSRRFKKTHHAAPLWVDDGFEQINPNNEWLKHIEMKTMSHTSHTKPTENALSHGWATTKWL